MRKKVYLSMVLVTIFMLLSVVPALAVDTQIAYAKIPQDLLSEFSDVGRNESIKIFVWLDDSSTEEYQNIVSDIDEAMNMESDAIQNDAVNTTLLYGKENGATDDIEKIQNTIMQKRQIAQAVYLEKNTKIAEKLVDNGGEVVYISAYSPLIVFDATLSEAVDVAKNSNVVSLGSTKIKSEEIMEVALQEIGVASLNSSQFSAEGVKIGMIECQQYVDLSTAPFYALRNKIQVLGSGANGHSHANLVGATVLSTVSDFERFYSSGYVKGDNNEHYDIFVKTEELLSLGVNVINYSVGLYTRGAYYSDYSRWFDHIAYNHSVHCVFGMGNDGATRTSTIAMSYNGIGVGGINDRNTPQTSDDTRYDDSSYNSNNNSLAFKPDFSAPAVNIHLDNLSVPQTATGTSIASPIVTGVVAALCSHTPILLTKQALVKSVISASVSKRTALNYDTMSDENGEITIGYRPYGSGIVNAYNAIDLLEDGNYVTGSLTNSESEDVFSLGTIPAGKTVTVTLTFLKRVRISNLPHESQGESMLESRLPDLDAYVCPVGTYLPGACTKDSTYTGSRTTKNNVEKIEFTTTHTAEYLVCVDKYTSYDSYEVIYAVSWMIDDGTLK